MMSPVLCSHLSTKTSSLSTVCARRLAVGRARWSSTDATPPLLLKIRGDLKNAMRAKDTARLNVLRAIITDTNNASKGPTPVTKDLQILAMLKKRKAASEAAAEEAKNAKREDLQKKQEAEISVIDEYAGAVEVMSEQDVKEAVRTTITALKGSQPDLKAGTVMKELFKPRGALDGRPVEKAQVAKVVNETLTASL